MTAAQLLEQLRGLHVPAVNEVATQAGASALLVALVTGATVLGIGIAGYWWRATAWRRTAFRELRNVTDLAGAGQTDLAWQRLAVLLRRLAKHVDPQTAASTQTGENWLRQLDGFFGTDQFTRGSARLIATRPYQLTSGLDGAGVSDSTKPSNQKINHEQQGLIQTTDIVRQFLARRPGSKQ